MRHTRAAYPEFHTLVKILEEEGGGMRDPNAKLNMTKRKPSKQESSESETDDDSESSSGSY